MLPVASRLRAAFLLLLICAMAGCAPAVTRPASEPQPAPVACDCVHYAYEALKRVNVRISTVPVIVGTTGPNSYARGVALIHFPQPCSVYIHEFAHHDQYLHGREAQQKYDAEWWALEANAKAIEKRAMEYPDQCRTEEVSQ